MLDISDVRNTNGFAQVAIANLGLGASPHDIDFTEEDTRLVVTD